MPKLHRHTKKQVRKHRREVIRLRNAIVKEARDIAEEYERSRRGRR